MSLSTTLLRENEVRAVFGIKSKTTLYECVKRGLLPPGVRAFGRATGWPSNEIEKVRDARAAGLDADHVRQVVTAIMKQRDALAQRVVQEVAHHV